MLLMCPVCVFVPSSRAGDANRMVKVALEEVRQLNGEMNALERKFQLPHGEGSAAASGQPPRGDGLMGSIPWSPSGHHLVTNIERPTTNVLVRTTHHPALVYLRGGRGVPSCLSAWLAQLTL